MAHPPVHLDNPQPAHFDLITDVTGYEGKSIGTLFASFSLDILQKTLESLTRPGQVQRIRDGRGADVLATTFHLWRDGAHAIFLSRDGPARIETVRESRGERPWSRLSPRKRQYLRIRPTRRP